MCGIGGIMRVFHAGTPPPPLLDAIPESWLDILDESVAHRGPDGRGRFRDRVVRGDGSTVDIALVHRRLSIIDHAGGAQPMVIGQLLPSPAEGRADRSEAGGDTPLLSRDARPYERLRARACPACGSGVVALVYNGCIYNHRDLRSDLLGAGHEFASDHSDTEVLLHGLRAWGTDVFLRASGMFAAAIWDARRCELALSRDLFGEKPLVYRRADRWTIAFSSSCAGLARLAAATGSDQRPVAANVRRWIRAGFGGELPWDARSVPEASTLVFDPLDRLDGYGVRWLARHDPAPTGVSPEDEFERLVRRAVLGMLEADVPLGCFLSGGVDSSLIAAFAREGRQRLETFSVRMPDARYDESAHAALVARHLGTRHTVLDCAPSPAEDLPRLVHQLGLPFGDSSLLPTFWVSRATRARASVALAGDGGDEMFAGYDRHSAAGIGALARLLRLVPGSALPARDPRRVGARLRKLVAAARANDLYELLAIFPRPDLGRLLAGMPRAEPHGCPMHSAPGPDMTRGSGAMLHIDRHEYLPHDLLRKTDTASMAVALEVRAPFLSRELARAALAAPIGVLMPHRRRKGLLRAIARRHLPPEVVDRPKMGFAIPIGEWFRSDFGRMRQVLHDHLESADPFPGLDVAGVGISMDFVRRMLREHDAAGEASPWPWKGRDHAQRLYVLLVLSIWSRWLASLRPPPARASDSRIITSPGIGSSS